MYQKIINELKPLAEPEFAEWLKPFLNIREISTEKVLGIRVPKLRKLANQYKNLSIENIQNLLNDNIHEAL